MNSEKLLKDGPADGVASDLIRMASLNHGEAVEPASPVMDGPICDEQFVMEHCQSVRRGMSGNVFGIPPGDDRRPGRLGTSWCHAAAVVRSILKASQPTPVVVVKEGAPEAAAQRCKHCGLVIEKSSTYKITRAWIHEHSGVMTCERIITYAEPATEGNSLKSTLDNAKREVASWEPWQRTDNDPCATEGASEAIAAEGKLDNRFTFQVRLDMPKDAVYAGTEAGAYLMLRFPSKSDEVKAEGAEKALDRPKRYFSEHCHHYKNREIELYMDALESRNAELQKELDFLQVKYGLMRINGQTLVTDQRDRAEKAEREIEEFRTLLQQCCQHIGHCANEGAIEIIREIKERLSR